MLGSLLKCLSLQFYHLDFYCYFFRTKEVKKHLLEGLFFIFLRCPIIGSVLNLCPATYLARYLKITGICCYNSMHQRSLLYGMYFATPM